MKQIIQEFQQIGKTAEVQMVQLYAQEISHGQKNESEKILAIDTTNGLVFFQDYQFRSKNLSIAI